MGLRTVFSHSLPIVQPFLSKRDGQLLLETRVFPPRDPEADAGGAAVSALPRSAPFCPELQRPAPASRPALGPEPRPVFLESAVGLRRRMPSCTEWSRERCTLATGVRAYPMRRGFSGQKGQRRGA